MRDYTTFQDHLDDYADNPVDDWFEITARNGDVIDLSECIKLTYLEGSNSWRAEYVNEDGEVTFLIIGANYAMTEFGAQLHAVAYIKVHGELPWVNS